MAFTTKPTTLTPNLMPEHSFAEKLTANRQCRECARLKNELDADCNDCIHFKRGKMEAIPGLKMFHGVCGKDDSAVKAFPNQFTGKPCFERRPILPHSCIEYTEEEFYSILAVHRSAFK